MGKKGFSVLPLLYSIFFYVRGLERNFSLVCTGNLTFENVSGKSFSPVSLVFRKAANSGVKKQKKKLH